MRAIRSLSGFTLVEWILVIVLIGIIGVISTPLLLHHQTFQERFFSDELAQLLRYGHKVALSTGCEVQVAYKDKNHISLFQRKSCTQEAFSLPIRSPYLTDDSELSAKIPQSVSLKLSLPIYIDAKGRAFDENHHFLKKAVFKLKNRMIVMDGTTGFVYEENL